MTLAPWVEPESGDLRPSGRRFDIASLPLLIFALAELILFLFAVFSGAQRAPYADQLAYISTAYSLRDGELSLPEYLWLTHVGHHIVWVRVLTILDMTLFHGALWLQIIAALWSVLALAWLCGRAAVQAAPVSAKLFGAVAGGALILTAYNASDISQTGNIVYAFAAFFAVAAIGLSLRGDGRLVWFWRLGALACAILAAFGNAVALAAWPALLVCAALDPRGWKGGLAWILTILGVGAAFSGLYLLSGQAQALHDASKAANVGIFHRIFYLLTFIGAPFSRISALVGAGAGVACVVTSAALAWKTDWRNLQPSQRFAWSMVVFSFVTAAMAALGRADLGLDRAPQRYGILASVLQVGLLILVLGRPAMANRKVSRAAAAVFLLVLVGFQIAGAADLKNAAKRADNRVAAFRSGDRSPAVVSFVYPDAAFAEALYTRMDRDRLYLNGKAGK